MHCTRRQHTLRKSEVRISLCGGRRSSTSVSARLLVLRLNDITALGRVQTRYAPRFSPLFFSYIIHYKDYCVLYDYELVNCACPCLLSHLPFRTWILAVKFSQGKLIPLAHRDEVIAAQPALPSVQYCGVRAAVPDSGVACESLTLANTRRCEMPILVYYHF